MTIRASEVGITSRATAAECARAARGGFAETLLRAGAVLFRGFPLRSARDFGDFHTGLGDYRLLAYVGGAAKRQKVRSISTIPLLGLKVLSQERISKSWPTRGRTDPDRTMHLEDEHGYERSGFAPGLSTLICFVKTPMSAERIKLSVPALGVSAAGGRRCACVHGE